MSGTPTAVKQQPPSPPQSIDGEFDLSAVQQHIAALEQQAVQPQINSIGLVEQPIVSEEDFSSPIESTADADRINMETPPTIRLLATMCITLHSL